MTYQPHFDMDLAVGELGEQLVKSGLTGKVEVKTDRRVRETGNIYIETWQFRNPDQSDKKPSGINTTTADYWAIATTKGIGFVIVKTTELKILLRGNSYRQVSQPIANEHTNGSLGLLVPIKDLFRHIGF